MGSTISRGTAQTNHTKITKRRVFVKGVDEIWAADLVEMGRFSDWNKGIKYLLMVIDVFSKFGWIEPLQNKKGETVAAAFEKIFKLGRQPRLLWRDKGKEFYNKNVNQLLSKKNIKLYSTENEEKSSVVERFNRTIKQMMWKMFSANNNTIYVDKIGELLKNYNSSWHRSVQMSPVAASDIKNKHQVFANLYSNEIYKQVKKPKSESAIKFVFLNTNENFSIKDLLQTGPKKFLLLIKYCTQNQSLTA